MTSAHCATLTLLLHRDPKQAVDREYREEIMKEITDVMERHSNRRSFLKKSLVAGATATVGASVLGKGLPLLAQEVSNASITSGDARFFVSCSR